MPLSLAARAATAPPPSPNRDAAVDVARAGCLVVVVLLHALMVGVSVGAGGPVLENALENWPGFAAFSWFVQVMPLFFLLGGFSAHTQWERMRRRGHRSGDYVGGRIRRLFAPTAAALTAVALLLSGLVLVGVPSELVAVAGFRMSQPLWFLGVYVLCTVAVPPMVALHRRAPVVGVLLPVGAAVVVDIVRAATGVTGVGFANLVFVWLAVQQLGFWLAASPRSAMSRRRVAALGAAALGLLLTLCVVRVFSFDMLANLNPPTCALLLLAVVQLSGFRLVSPVLRGWAAHPAVGCVTGWISGRSMTVYLWHMPVLIVLAGGLLVSGAALPEPLSAAWWESRPLWLGAVLLAVTAVAAGVGRFERTRSALPSAPAFATAPTTALLAAATGAGGVLLTLLAGASPAAWVVAAAMAFAALRILRRTGTSAVVSR